MVDIASKKRLMFPLPKATPAVVAFEIASRIGAHDGSFMVFATTVRPSEWNLIHSYPAFSCFIFYWRKNHCSTEKNAQDVVGYRAIFAAADDSA